MTYHEIEAVLISMELLGEVERFDAADGTPHWRLTEKGQKRAQSIAASPAGVEWTARLHAARKANGQ